jgi:hypothetical protein
MTAAIHQPDYIPYPGYFFKIISSDIFIFLDDAQFSNDGGHDCNLIKTPQGTLRLKVPVRQTLGNRINEVATRDELCWKRRHLETIRLNYRRAPFFSSVYSVYEQCLLKPYDNIAELNIALIKAFCLQAGIERIFLKSSELAVHSRREERVIDICRAIGADRYFSGTGAAAYQSEKDFSRCGVELVYSGYRPVVYHQLWGGFTGNLSVLDYLFNCGFDFDRLEGL